MKSLLQALAWYADTVLSICWPEPEQPRLDDTLADKEAEEDVAEPRPGSQPLSEADWLGNNPACYCDEVGTGGQVGPDDVWPEQPDPLGHIVALLEDIHNILQHSPYFPAANTVHRQ